MQFKLLYILLLLLSGCSLSNPFIGQFKDKGALILQPIVTFDSDIVSPTISMLQIKDYIIWNKGHADHGITLYAYNIKNKKISIHKDTTEPFKYLSAQIFYKFNDSMVTSLCEAKHCRTDIRIQDSIQKIATYPFRIRERHSFNWQEDLYFSAIYPTDETAAYFIAQTDIKRTQYGVYEQSSQFFYPCTSCNPPDEKELPLLSPDFWHDAYIIKQKNKNRFAIFRKYYQLFDLIEVDELTIKPIKRNSTPHTLLTFQDQLNLEKQIVYQFFPGLSVESEKYIITLYQNAQQRYLLFWTWDGTPRYSYLFPKDYDIVGLCGNSENEIYALGISPEKKYQLFQVTCKR